MLLAELPTPALLLDLDVFESNLETMAVHARNSGKRLRSHAKAHKCLEIAQRQIARGACGVCVATVPEAEYLIGGGIRGVLLTSPTADPRKAARLAKLCAIDVELTVVVDHPQQVEFYEAAAAGASVRLNVLVDIDVGDHRTGIAPGEPALALARKVLDSPHLRLQGFQAYSVRGSHVEGAGDRAAFSRDCLSAAVETRMQILAEGVDAPILTGGSTGTFNIDTSIDGFTELQAGSYVLMDLAYKKIGGIDFGHALTVLATVVSANQPDRVTIDAGFKAFSTDRKFGPEALEIAGLRHEWAGDEFSFLYRESPTAPVRLGDKIRMIPPHCDPTVNLYDRIHAHRNGRVEEVWPVMGRFRCEPKN